jgi:hypothetical protein
MHSKSREVIEVDIDQIVIEGRHRKKLHGIDPDYS